MILTQYKVQVSYSIDGQTKDYTGWFAGRSASEAVDTARAFIARYMRPSCIISANATAS